MGTQGCPDRRNFLRRQRAKGKLRINHVDTRKKLARRGRISTPLRKRASCPPYAADAAGRAGIGHKLRQTKQGVMQRVQPRHGNNSTDSPGSRMHTHVTPLQEKQKLSSIILFFLSQFILFSLLSTISRIFYCFCHSLVVFPLFLPKKALSSSLFPLFRHEV